jgi:galactonate dehydratase
VVFTPAKPGMGPAANLPVLPIRDVRVVWTDGAFRGWLFVRIETESGLVGWGEATLEGREHAVAGAIDDFRRVLVGSDGARIRRITHLLTKHGYWESGPVISSAVGGVEMALWDLLGKALGLPVHALLGGAIRDRARVYSNAWYFGCAEPEEFAEHARATVALGYTALKFDPFGEAELVLSASEMVDVLARVRSVRNAVGPGTDILIEGHGRFSVDTAIRVGRALEQFDVGFFEEPIAGGSAESLRAVSSVVRIPIAAGERAYDLADFRSLINGGVSVLQPDVIHAGGLIRTLGVASLADAASVVIAPHNASGPVATAATLQIAALVPNLLIQEMFAPTDAPWKDAVASPGASIAGGHVAIPTGPGLGIEVDESASQAHPWVVRDLAMFTSGSILGRPIAGDGDGDAAIGLGDEGDAR